MNYFKGNFVISALYSTSLFKSTSLHSIHTGAYSFTSKGCWQHRMKEDKCYSLHKQPLLCKNWKMTLFFLLHKTFLRLPSPKIYKRWSSTDAMPVCPTTPNLWFNLACTKICHIKQIILKMMINISHFHLLINTNNLSGLHSISVSSEVTFPPINLLLQSL